MGRQPSKRQLQTELKRATSNSASYSTGRGIVIRRVNEKGTKISIIPAASKLSSKAPSHPETQTPYVEEVAAEVEKEIIEKEELTQVRPLLTLDINVRANSISYRHGRFWRDFLPFPTCCRTCCWSITTTPSARTIAAVVAVNGSFTVRTASATPLPALLASWNAINLILSTGLKYGAPKIAITRKQTIRWYYPKSRLSRSAIMATLPSALTRNPIHTAISFIRMVFTLRSCGSATVLGRILRLFS
jgi:hypothetical protein